LAAVGKYKNKKGQIFRTIATGGCALVKWVVLLTKDSRQLPEVRRTERVGTSDNLETTDPRGEKDIEPMELMMLC